MLRPYQQDAAGAVEAAWLAHKAALVVMPTGTGKTVLFGELARRFHAATGKRILVLAHREELIAQAANTLRKFSGMDVDIEMADQRARVASLFSLSHVVCGSVQTLVNDARLRRFGAADFGMVIVDEAHRSVAAGYRKVVAHFPAAKVLGVTATPDRLDDVALGNCYDVCAYTYEIRQAISDGWLVPIRQKEVVLTELELDKVVVRAGDLATEALSAQMVEQGQLHAVAKPLIDLSEGRRTLAFAATVAHAHALAATLNAYEPGCAEAVDGAAEKEERAACLARFRAGAFRILVNCALFTEGWDEWTVQCVACARPTKSRALYTQMIGRGTRICPDCNGPCEHKPNLLVLDFNGNSKKHALISPLDVLGGKDLDEKVRAAAKKIVAKQPGIDSQKALQLAEREVEMKRLQAERAKAKRDAKKAERVDFKATDVDPFGVFALEASEGVMGQPFAQMSQGQRSMLKQAGLKDSDLDKMSKRQAGQMIGELQRRRGAGLCTYKQTRLLSTPPHNYDCKTMTKDAATALIDAIIANNWRPLPKPPTPQSDFKEIPNGDSW